MKTVVDLQRLEQKLKDEWALGKITMADRHSVSEFLKPFCFEIRSPVEIEEAIEGLKKVDWKDVPYYTQKEVDEISRLILVNLLRWALCQKQDTWDFEEKEKEKDDAEKD